MATNPYTAPTITGYNASPPADDGSQVSSNEITWAKHKTKLADPIKTLVETNITNLTTAFGKTINTDDAENNTINGSLAFGYDELTIATGAITPNRSHHTVDTQADAASDDLDTINTTSMDDGAILILSANNAGRTVVLKHSTGNILLADDSDFSLDDTDKRILLQRFGSSWYELARAPGGLSAASQAQMEAATATNVALTPANAKYHPGVAKGWAVWQPDGTLDASYNVGSLDDNGAGDFDINWSTAFSSGDYSAVVTLDFSAIAARFSGYVLSSTASVANIGSWDSAPARNEAGVDGYSLVAFGDQ